MTIAEAIAALRPGTEWTMRNDDLSTLVFGDGSSAPDQAEVSAMLVSLERKRQCEAVNAERDRRLMVFPYNGHVFDFDEASQSNIQGAFSIAMAAVMAGAQVGDLRWSDPSYDFSWITSSNEIVPMDAHAVVAFGKAAAAWKSGHIFRARAIKDLNPIPADFKADAHWPAS